MGVDDELLEPGRSRLVLPSLSRLPGHLLWRAHARVLVVTAEVLPTGVTLPAYAALLALGDGQPRSQQDLADTTATSRTAMVALAADLAEQGLVHRVRNAEDRRCWNLTRTPAGAVALRRWRRHVRELEDAVAAPFGVAEREELRGLLLAVAGPDVGDAVPAELLDALTFLTTRAHVRVHREVLAGLEPLDLEPRHLGALTALTETGPVSQADLARRLGTSDPSVVQIVDHLEGRELVERRRLPEDRRTLALHLLPSAPDVLVGAHRAVGEVLAVVLEPLTRSERERLVELLRRLVTGA